jgi:FixJ family two-component response regulator
LATREEYHRRLDTLTATEREVLDLVIGGVPNREIAGRLGKSLPTVEACRGKIFRKTRVDSVAQLVRLLMIAEPRG